MLMKTVTYNLHVYFHIKTKFFKHIMSTASKQMFTKLPQPEAPLFWAKEYW